MLSGRGVDSAHKRGKPMRLVTSRISCLQTFRYRWVTAGAAWGSGASRGPAAGSRPPSVNYAWRNDRWPSTPSGSWAHVLQARNPPRTNSPDNTDRSSVRASHLRSGRRSLADLRGFPTTRIGGPADAATPGRTTQTLRRRRRPCDVEPLRKDDRTFTIEQNAVLAKQRNSLA